ncbi:26783_t:CDS:2 [Racocetra persica]|uniref:26783_t:CDS:1 n=1 Tax=Racocetra persica TaxID=160502 RepID=A0ACA9RW29_9GLOM|nr:26783_t:CDS:2 [Racocetra persica]
MDLNNVVRSLELRKKEERLTSNIENLKILFEKDTNTENNHETTDDLKSQFKSLLKVSGSNDKILNGDDENPNVRIKTNNALDVANRVIGVLYDILKKEKDKLKMLADSQEQDLFEFMHSEECSDATPKQVQKIQDSSSTTFEPSNATKNVIPFNKIENDRNDEWEIV